MKRIIIFLLCILSFSIVTNAQSGTLDSSFGNNGKAYGETFTGTCQALALQKDGKIVTGGYHDANGNANVGFVIARFNTDGSVDESFGKAGRTIISNADRVTDIVALSIQEDGKIIALGSFDNYYDIGIVRLKTDGRPDSSFNGDGILTIDVDGQDSPGDMVLQPDGKIVITGMQGLADDELPLGFVMRILTNGETDESFGVNGIVTTPVPLAIYQVNAIALQNDSKILIGGKYISGSLFLIRFLTNGTIDSTFDEEKDGIATIKLDAEDISYSILYDITLQPDGKILAAGTAGSTNYKMAIIRFKSDGSVDSAFGDKIGYSVLPMSTGYSIARTITMEADKKIVLTGVYNDAQPGSGFGLVKYNIDGSLDSSFGENGIAVASFSDELQLSDARDGALQTDGKIIVGGSATLTGEHKERVGLVRFNNEVTPAPPEFAKIKKWLGHYGFIWNDWPGNKVTHYSVGRSTNASTFSEIAQVADVPGQKKYQFEDPAPPSGIVYYQLTAVRSDGKTVSSNIISAGTAVAAIKLFPNPARNSLRVEGLSITDKTKLTIADISGNIKVAATATGSSHTIDIAQLKPGNYMLRMETNGNVVTRMFVKE